MIGCNSTDEELEERERAYLQAKLDEVKRLQDENSSLEREIRDLEAEVRDLQAEKSRLECEIEYLRDQLAEVE